MQNQSAQNPAASLSRIGFVMTPIGLLLLALTVLSIWTTTAWLKRTVETQGTVVEMLRTRDKDDGGWMYEPVVRFETAEGKAIKFEANFRSSPPAYRVGDTVKIVYLPDAPERAQIRSFLSLWMGPMIMALIGTVFFGVGASMLAASRRVSRELAQSTAAALAQR
jgi:hypothetical protein